MTNGSIELGKLGKDELEARMLEMGFETDPTKNGNDKKVSSSAERTCSISEKKTDFKNCSEN